MNCGPTQAAGAIERLASGRLARSPPSGNAILRGGDKGPEKALEIQSTDCRDKWVHECPRFGAIRTELGNLCLRKTAWWGWEDSNFQPHNYQPLTLCHGPACWISCLRANGPEVRALRLQARFSPAKIPLPRTETITDRDPVRACGAIIAEEGRASGAGGRTAAHSNGCR